MPKSTLIRFEPITESWSDYSIDGGATVVRVKIVVTAMRKVDGTPADNPIIQIASANITTVMSRRDYNEMTHPDLLTETGSTET